LTLPGKHRLAVAFGKETTPAGSSFTIRKFKDDPLTIVDLIMNGTIDESIAAYLWMLMENKMSVMVVGPTGAGKTTALNAIACLVRPDYKMISVEEVQEINLPQENWVSTIARTGFGGEGDGEVTLYDLIKSAVRHRPTMILWAKSEVKRHTCCSRRSLQATAVYVLCTLTMLKQLLNV
jgi:flagellar protein FlaI